VSFEPADPISPETLALTPAEATAKLAEMQTTLHPPPSSTPADAQEAQQLLTKLTADASWSRALVNGDPQTRRQFDSLVAQAAERDIVGDALAGITDDERAAPLFSTTVGGELPPRVVAEFAQDQLAAGVDAASVAQAISGTPVSLAEHRAATALLSARMADPAWVKAVTSGDYLAKKEWSLLTIVLSSTVET
jgi:hypothetical protein